MEQGHIRTKLIIIVRSRRMDKIVKFAVWHKMLLQEKRVPLHVFAGILLIKITSADVKLGGPGEKMRVGSWGRQE